MLITCLLLILEVYSTKPTHTKSWARNFLMLDLTLGPSFKVKQWFTGFGELSFRWIQICIGLRCIGLVIYAVCSIRGNLVNIPRFQKVLRWYLPQTILRDLLAIDKPFTNFKNIFNDFTRPAFCSPCTKVHWHFFHPFNIDWDFVLDIWSPHKRVGEI